MGVRNFLTFFRLTPGGQTPQPILTQNGSIGVDLRKDVPFAVKNRYFSYRLIFRAPKRSKFCKFLEFSLDLAFNIRGPEREHPLFFIGAQRKWHSG